MDRGRRGGINTLSRKLEVGEVSQVEVLGALRGRSLWLLRMLTMLGSMVSFEFAERLL